MIKAVIFDLDGTIADTLAPIAYFANNALKHFGFKEIPQEKYKILVGDGAKILVERMLNEIGEYSEEMAEKVYEKYTKPYDENPLHLTVEYDGMTELLKKLRKQGIKNCILSNKPHDTAVKVAEQLFPGLFDIVIGKSDKYPVKPDTTSLFALLDELGVTKDECLYVGDTKTDMETGKNADIFTIGVLWGFRERAELEEYHADAIVKRAEEIYEIAMNRCD